MNDDVDDNGEIDDYDDDEFGSVLVSSCDERK